MFVLCIFKQKDHFTSFFLMIVVLYLFHNVLTQEKKSHFLLTVDVVVIDVRQNKVVKKKDY